MPDYLWPQLGYAVQMAVKEDQIVWSIFGIFCAVNGGLLVALFTTGASRFGVSLVGVVVSVVWALVQGRALGWLDYYEQIIQSLEEHLEVPLAMALSARVNTLTFEKTVGDSWPRVRVLMCNAGWVVTVGWVVTAELIITAFL